MFGGDKCNDAPSETSAMLQATVACENEAKFSFATSIGPEHSVVWISLVLVWVSALFGGFLFTKARANEGRIKWWSKHTASLLTAAVGLYLAYVTCDDKRVAWLFPSVPAKHQPGQPPHCHDMTLEAVSSCGAYYPWVSSNIVSPVESTLMYLANTTVPTVGAGYAGFVFIGLVCGFLGDFFVNNVTLPLAILFFGLGHAAYVISVDMILQLCANSDAAALLIPLRAFFFVVCCLYGTKHTVKAVGWCSITTLFVVLYSLLLVETVTKGVSLAIIRPKNFWGLGLGTFFFFLSDLAVGASLFGKKQHFGLWPLNRLHINDAIWFMYSGGQMLIASSIVSAHSFIGSD